MTIIVQVSINYPNEYRILPSIDRLQAINITATVSSFGLWLRFLFYEKDKVEKTNQGKLYV